MTPGKCIIGPADLDDGEQVSVALLAYFRYRRWV